MGCALQLLPLCACAFVLFLLGQQMVQGQPGSPLNTLYRFLNTDLYALQQLYANWNVSTPDLAKNLAGWRVIPNNLENPQSIPCPCFQESWRGVLCLRRLSPTPSGFHYIAYNVSIVGLTLTDASLTGSLPAAIGNLTSLVSLTLTGNPSLTGRLAPELQLLSDNLNVLDLHGNGFNGSIPTTIAALTQLQELDLSGNQLDGNLQVDFSNLTLLRTLNLSRNSLAGDIQQKHFQGLRQLITLDLSSNKFTGPLFNLANSDSLNTLNLSHNSFTGDLRPSNILNTKSSSSLKVMDLSSNAFTGPLPDFSAWTNLKVLFLDNNYLNGTFDIGDVIKLPVLELLSITNNSITNVLYNGSSYSAIAKFGINLQGNPYCIQTSSQYYLQKCVCSQICIDPDITQASSKSTLAVIATSVAASLLTIAILVISLVFWKTRREKQKLQLQVQQHFAEKDIKPTIFTFNQLKIATEDFSEKMKIGEGSFGAVYKGHLQGNANPVAVKQLFIKNQQSITEFLNEVVVVTAIKHRNLVNLKGCCVREDQRLLVYEYLDNNDLAHHLFHQGVNQHLSWPTRFKICLGIARGLNHPHVSAQPRIIHRDIKASNILMDKDLQPKIADFGLALFFPDEQTHIITKNIAGTRGYWAPEYVTMGQLSEKADVYSFGVLLLELVSGRKNLDYNMPEHKVYLCQWGRELYSTGNVMELVDPALSLGKDEEKEVRLIIDIALLCLQIEPERRPTMAAIVATLEGSLNLEAKAMQHLSQPKESLEWAHVELRPFRKEFDSPVFSSEGMGSSSIISFDSLVNDNSSASVRPT